ncbi:MAG: hypothetical protein H6577_18950 [Lewinellaceae bacterium]|nr:hypothetical protein [Saprospiraceae bacterium]MCB9340205.1 hypothetical protein [Lewinellaceae bacterium]
MKNEHFGSVMGLICLFAIIILSLPFQGGAANKTWTAGSGNWSEAAKWSPVGVPDPTDTVIVTGSVTLDIAPIVAKLTLNGSITGTNDITVTGDMTLSGGTFQTIGNLIIGGNFLFSGGFLGNNDSTTGDVTVSGTTIMNGGWIRRKKLILNGNADWNTGHIAIANSGTLRIGAQSKFSINVTTDRMISGWITNNPVTDPSFPISGQFECFGTIEKSDAASTVTVWVSNPPTIDTLKVLGGKLAMRSSASSPIVFGNGKVEIANNATFEMFIGEYTFENIAFSGSGTLSVGVSGSSATTIARMLQGTTHADTLNLKAVNGNVYDNIGVNWKSVDFKDGGGLFSTQPITIYGNVSFVKNAASSCNFFFDKDVTIQGNLTFAGGALGTSAFAKNLTVQGFSSFSSNNEVRHANVLLGQGANIFPGQFNLFGSNTKVTIPDGKTLTALANGGDIFILNTGGGASTLDNQGKILKQGTGKMQIGGTTVGVSPDGGVRFSNTDTIRLEAGSFQVRNGTGVVNTHSGVFDALPNTEWWFWGANALNGAQFIGDGNIVGIGFSFDSPTFNAGTTFSTPVNLRIDGRGITDNVGLTWKNVVFNDGFYAGNGNVTVLENVTMPGKGTIANTGKFLINGNASIWGGLQGTSNTDSLIINGTTTFYNQISIVKRIVKFNGNSNLVTNIGFDGGEIINSPGDTCKLPGTLLFTTSTTNIGKFTNHGVIFKNAAGQVEIRAVFNNDGKIKLDAGTLYFNPVALGTHKGIFEVSTGAALTFAGTHTFTDWTGQANGTGTFNHNIDGPLAFGGDSKLLGDWNLNLNGTNITLGGVFDKLKWKKITLNGTLTSAQLSSQGVSLNADTILIPASREINVNAKGLRGGKNGSQFGNNGETYASDLVTIVPGSLSGTGASYGGLGEDNGNGQPNPVYGNKYFPDLMGSGGGGGFTGEVGGNGGGMVQVRTQSLILNGKIVANGGNGNIHTGGGSGGSVLILANEISGTGSIEAKGGTGGCGNCFGASGGGGRVAIYTHNPNFPAANISVAPGAPNFGSPQPGTIVYLNCNYETNAAVDSILYPVGNILPLDTTIQPMVVVQNLSPNTQTFPVQFKIGNFYEDVTYVNLASGQRDTITFAAFKAEQVGTWPATATIQISNDDCLEGNQKSVNVPIASGDSPAIAAVSPNSGGNTGATTIKITGQNFREGINARIEHSSGSYIMAHYVEFVSSTQIFASVNLQGAALGMYDVVVQNPDFQTASFSGFEVTEGSIGWEGFAQPGCLAGNFDPGQLLEIKLETPEFARANRPFEITIRFWNKGNIDIPIPIRTIRCELPEGYLGLPDECHVFVNGIQGCDIYNPNVSFPTYKELVVKLQENNGPTDILRAGAKGEIKLLAISHQPITAQIPQYSMIFKIDE